MNINELERKRTRLIKQLSDVLREKDEIQSSLNQVLKEIEAHKSSDLEQQIWNKSREIDYDTRDYNLGQVVNGHKKDSILCNSSNTWDTHKQSKFIESMLLGLPLTLYMADIESALQVIDGNQRVLALSAFINNELQLSDLKVLDSLNGLYFKDLVTSRQRKLLNTSIRVIIFSNTNDELRKDLSDRFNGKTINKSDYYEFLLTEEGQQAYKAGYTTGELSFDGECPYPDTSYPSGSFEYEAFHYGVRDAYTTLGRTR